MTNSREGPDVDIQVEEHQVRLQVRVDLPDRGPLEDLCSWTLRVGEFVYSQDMVFTLWIKHLD